MVHFDYFLYNKSTASQVRREKKKQEFSKCSLSLFITLWSGGGGGNLYTCIVAGLAWNLNVLYCLGAVSASVKMNGEKIIRLKVKKTYERRINKPQIVMMKCLKKSDQQNYNFYSTCLAKASKYKHVPSGFKPMI